MFFAWEAQEKAERTTGNHIELYLEKPLDKVHMYLYDLAWRRGGIFTYSEI